MNNSDANKRLVINTSYLYIRQFVSLFIGLLTSRVVLDALGIEDYGLYSLVGGFVVLLNIFSASLTGSATRFITYGLGENNIERLKATFSTVSTLMVIISVIMLVLGAVVGYIFIGNFLNISQEKHDTAFIVYFCSLVVFSMNILTIPYTAIVTAHERMKFYACMSIGEAILKLGIAYFLYIVSDSRIIYYAVLLALLSIFLRVIYSIYARKQFAEVSFSMKLDKKILHSVFSFSAWLSFGCGAGILKDFGGNIVLNIFYGLAYNASNGIASQVKGLISSFANNIGTAISPQITKSYAGHDVDRAIKLTIALAKFQACCSLIVILPIILNTNILLNLWLKEVPVSATLFVRLMACICFVVVVSQSYGPLYLAIGNIKRLQIIASSINIFYIPICYILYELGGDPATYLYLMLFFETVQFVICYTHLNTQIAFPLKKIFYDIFVKCTFILVVAILTTKYTCLLFHIQNQFWLFIYNLIVSEFIALFLLYTCEFDKKEKEYILKMVGHKICSKCR